MSKAVQKSGVRKLRGIKVADSKHPEIRRLKRLGYEPSIHGTKVWRSCYAMMEFLEKDKHKAGTRIMDVGCGWGVLSAYLAKRFKADVLAVDADGDLEPYVALHAELNGLELDFLQAKFQQLTVADFEDFDMVVGTDICFWDELTEPLYKMIRRALRGGVKRVIIGDPGRPPFWELSEKCSRKFDATTIAQCTEEPIKTKKHLLIIEG